LLAKRIQHHIDEGKPLPFKWNCEHCSSTHIGNLVRRARSVLEEYDLTVCRPDIALLNESGTPVWALEVVVTHPPEGSARQYYAENGIALAVFKIESDKDMVGLAGTELLPTEVDQCISPKCDKCKRYMERLDLWVIEGPCHKCQRIMKVASVQNAMSEYGPSYAPEEFTRAEIKLARGLGCLLKVKYSHTRREKYLANTCPHCEALAGDFYLNREYVQPARDGELRVTKEALRNFCANCDQEEMEAMRRKDIAARETEHKIRAEEFVASERARTKDGFCIRCATPIARNMVKPLCSDCFPYEAKLDRRIVPVDPEYSCCMWCGTPAITTRLKPMCMQCFIAHGKGNA
jgi:hypothetical protein